MLTGIKEITEWKPVKGYEGLYEISEKGVYSLRKNRMLKPTKSGGYPGVSLTKNNKVKRENIHRLVAIHFIDNPMNKPCVNHIDHNRGNFSIDNLEWVTHSENIKKAILFGSITYKKGVEHHLHGYDKGGSFQKRKHLKKCIICFNDYYSYQKRAKYCSRECFNKKEPPNKGIDSRFKKECLVCNKNYYTYKVKSKYCSNSCRAKGIGYKKQH